MKRYASNITKLGLLNMVWAQSIGGLRLRILAYILSLEARYLDAPTAQEIAEALQVQDVSGALKGLEDQYYIKAITEPVAVKQPKRGKAAHII